MSLCSACVLVSLPGARAAAPEGYRPAPQRTRGAVWQGGRWVLEAEDLHASLRALDPDERRHYLASRTGIATDPFGGEGFLTFLLELENRTQGPLVFQPQACRVVTQRKEFLQPLDVPAIGSTYGLVGRPAPADFERIRPVLYDGETILPPGGRASGLLVFRKPDRRTRRFVLEISWTAPEGLRRTFAVAYQRSKKPRER